MQVFTHMHSYSLHAKFPTEQIKVRKRSKPGPGGSTVKLPASKTAKRTKPSKAAIVLQSKAAKPNRVEKNCKPWIPKLAPLFPSPAFPSLHVSASKLESLNHLQLQGGQKRS